MVSPSAAYPSVLPSCPAFHLLREAVGKASTGLRQAASVRPQAGPPRAAADRS